MELKRIAKYTLCFFMIVQVLFFIFPKESFCINLPADGEGSASEKTLILKIEKNTSLYEVIKKYGFEINDNDVIPFLREFMEMNENIKSIGFLKKSEVIKIPLGKLRKVKARTLISTEKTIKPVSQKSLVKKTEAKSSVARHSLMNRAMILKNIELLFDFFDKEISVETDGFKLLNVNERSVLSFDTHFFPLINFKENRVLILDLSGLLPEELKDVIEVAWPEYKVVNCRGKSDLKSIIGALLKSMGYFVLSDRKVIAVGHIEYDADFLILNSNDDLLNSEIAVIGIVGDNEFDTPEKALEWFNERGLNVVELSNNKVKKNHGDASKSVEISKHKDEKEFTEKILTHLGYEFSRNNTFNIADRKEYSYKIKADLSIKSGNRSKIIEFAEISDYEIKYAKKKGLDIIDVMPWEERKDIIQKILSLFPLEYMDSTELMSEYITPPGVKYRLLSPGVFVHSIKGSILLIDSGSYTELLKQLIDERVNILIF